MKRVPIAEIILIITGSILYFWANFQRVAVPGAMFSLLQSDLNATAQNIASLGASFMYVYALSQLFVGILISRYGGFRVVTWGSILFFTGSLLFPFAHSFKLLYISRILIGTGSACFYLSMLNETRKIVPHKNFGIAVSLVLLVGYLGGIVANAPLVICINAMGWRETFFITAVITTVIALLFITVSMFSSKPPVDKTVSLDLSLFPGVFLNGKNLNIYAFACLNYGLYYVIQTVIGKKFLEDFCEMTTVSSSLILSAMGALYAISGSVIAFLSKISLSRRTIYLRIAALNTFGTFLIISLCVIFNIKLSVIPCILFCSIAFWASLSPLLVPLLHDINGEKTAGTAISIMICGFYVAVGLLGNGVGFCLDKLNTVNIMNTTYENCAYIFIFSACTLVAVTECINVFKIEESRKTKRILSYVKYREAEIESVFEEEHWHDKYEHDLYNNP